LKAAARLWARATTTQKVPIKIYVNLDGTSRTGAIKIITVKEDLNLIVGRDGLNAGNTQNAKVTEPIPEIITAKATVRTGEIAATWELGSYILDRERTPPIRARRETVTRGRWIGYQLEGAGNGDGVNGEGASGLIRDSAKEVRPS
jgi:hypothetical protein